MTKDFEVSLFIGLYEDITVCFWCSGTCFMYLESNFVFRSAMKEEHEYDLDVRSPSDELFRKPNRGRHEEFSDWSRPARRKLSGRGGFQQAYGKRNFNDEHDFESENNWPSEQSTERPRYHHADFPDSHESPSNNSCAKARFQRGNWNDRNYRNQRKFDFSETGEDFQNFKNSQSGDSFGSESFGRYGNSSNMEDLYDILSRKDKAIGEYEQLEKNFYTEHSDVKNRSEVSKIIFIQFFSGLR